MKFSLLSSNKSSRRLLIQLIAAHIFGTIVAYTVYIRLSSLGDGYAPGDFQGFNGNSQDFTSTVIVHAIYHYIGAFLPGFLAPMALGLVVAITTWYAFRDIYKQINRQLFWICNLFPHFLIWSGSSSKEQVVMIFGIIVIGFAAKRSFSGSRLKITSLAFVSLSLGFILLIRPNYFVIYFTIFLTSIFTPTLNLIKINRLSVGIWVLTFTLITMGAIFFAFFYTNFFSKDVITYMKRVEASFMNYEAGSNRYNIQWDSIFDFLYNSLWGIPQGFIGPTLIEAISKPVQFPVFLEGVIYLFVLYYLFFKILKLAIASKLARFHILPFYFITLVIVFVSYPYLIFNAGSALRYKQAMHPFLIFYPMLILAYARANKTIRKHQ